MRTSETFERLRPDAQRRVVRVLTSSLAVVRDRRHWTQFVFARDAKGRTVDVHSRSALCFCIVGVIRKFAADIDEALRVIACLEDFTDGVPLQGINDRAFGHQGIVTLLASFLSAYERHVMSAQVSL